MATAPKNIPLLPIYVYVPPTQDVPNVAGGQEIIFQSMNNQNFNICFGPCAAWPEVNNQSFVNVASKTITAPHVLTQVNYSVVLFPTTCTVSKFTDTTKTIHVTSTGRR